jgi:hypothetical protein
MRRKSPVHGVSDKQGFIVANKSEVPMRNFQIEFTAPFSARLVASQLVERTASLSWVVQQTCSFAVCRCKYSQQYVCHK